MGRLPKKDLDAMGRKLFEAARLDQAVTDRVADSPEMFASVLKKIDANRRAETGLSGARFGVGFPAVRVAGLAAFPLLIAVFAVFSILHKGPGADLSTAVPAIPVQEKTGSRLSTHPPELGNHDIVSDVPAAEPEPVFSPRPVRASYKADRPAKNMRRSRTPAMEEPLEEFYPLTFAGDPYETARGGRVVRVDMPRSSLFAMGVNLPLENEMESVKADLLIGPDGVARGIRLVR